MSRARHQLTAGLLAAFLLLPGLAGAGTYYVAKHGSNVNAGTQAQPWLTIQYAVTNAQSGDTILVGTGAYIENVTFATNINTLTLKGGHSTNDWSWHPGNHPTTVRGKVSLGVPLSTSNTIVGLVINANGGNGIEVPYHQFAKGMVTISHCVITNASWGLYSEAGCDFNVFNTVVARCAQGGANLNGGAGTTGINMIDNCTFVAGKRANIWVPNGGRTIIRNTIAYGAYGTGGSQNEGYGIAVGATEERSADVSYSLVYGNTVNFNGEIALGGGMITNQAPQFVSYTGGNYRLAAGSPGIDGGVTIAEITNDLLGLARPQGSAYDMGAYEYMLPTAPAAPGGLSALNTNRFQIHLNWTDNADNESGFRIERKIGAGGSWAEADSVASDVTAWQNAGLAANTEYHYRVYAYNDGGNSDYSNIATASTPDNRNYVALHGSDTTGDGSQANPWATIGYAVTNVASGDAILIGEGTYTENVVLTNTIHTLTIKGGHNTNDWSWDPSNHPTVIKGTTGARIQLGGDTSFNGLPSVSNTIMGLTLIGGQHGVRSPWHGSVMGSVTISHCIITNQGANGWSISANGGCDFTLVNTLVGYSDIGLYSPSAGGPIGTNYIFNCTFVTSKRAHVWTLGGKTVVRNTIVYGAYGTGGHLNEGYGIAASATEANSADVSYSLVYGNTVNTNGLVTYGAGMITNAAPVFVDADAHDYRLQKNSPGHNTGTIIEGIINDLDLKKRPMGGAYDMGAYEIFQGEPGLRMIWR